MSIDCMVTVLVIQLQDSCIDSSLIIMRYLIASERVNNSRLLIAIRINYIFVRRSYKTRSKCNCTDLHLTATYGAGHRQPTTSGCVWLLTRREWIVKQVNFFFKITRFIYQVMLFYLKYSGYLTFIKSCDSLKQKQNDCLELHYALKSYMNNACRKAQPSSSSISYF